MRRIGFFASRYQGPDKKCALIQNCCGAKELQTFLDYPPMQKGASFNLDAVKAEMAKKMEQAEAASKGPSQ